MCLLLCCSPASKSPQQSHVLSDISFLEVFKNILGFLSVMLKFFYSWIQRRPMDLPGSLSPLILGRLNYYGNCICVFSYFLHAQVTFGGILFRPTIISPIWSLLLFISLPKEKLNLIVMIKVTADSQVKKSMLPPSQCLLVPQLSHPLQDASVLGKKESGE